MCDACVPKLVLLLRGNAYNYKVLARIVPFQTLCIGVKHSSEWEGASHDCNLLMETEMSDHSLFLLGNKTSWWYLEFNISLTGRAARPGELFPVVGWGHIGR